MPRLTTGYVSRILKNTGQKVLRTKLLIVTFIIRIVATHSKNNRNIETIIIRIIRIHIVTMIEGIMMVRNIVRKVVAKMVRTRITKIVRTIGIVIVPDPNIRRSHFTVPSSA